MKVWNSGISGLCRSIICVVGLGVLAAFSSSVFAGGDSKCHFHGSSPASEATVVTCAEIHKERLIKKGTIEASWALIKNDSIEQVEAKGGKKEWKVTFKDPAPKEKAKETLYMFFSLPGNFLATNFSGK